MGYTKANLKGDGWWKKKKEKWDGRLNEMQLWQENKNKNWIQRNYENMKKGLQVQNEK